MAFKWNPYHAATQGQNGNPFCLTVQGQLCEVVIEDLTPVFIDAGGGAGRDGSGWDEVNRGKDKKEVTRKKVTVSTIIDGIQYKQSIIVKDRPNLKVTDLIITISKKSTPVVKVEVKDIK